MLIKHVYRFLYERGKESAMVINYSEFVKEFSRRSLANYENIKKRAGEDRG